MRTDTLPPPDVKSGIPVETLERPVETPAAAPSEVRTEPPWFKTLGISGSNFSSEAGAAAGQRRDARQWAWLVGKIMFGVVVLALVAYLLLRSDKAQIFLNASSEGRFAVKGVVIYRGRPVENGTISISLESEGGAYGGSVSLPVSKQGTFSTDEKLGNGILPQAVTAEYAGVSANNRPLKASSRLDYARSIRQWWFLGICGAVALLLTILFTGQPGPFKARFLFIMTYLFTFASCALPIVSVIYIGLRPDLRLVMINSPVGVLKAKATEEGRLEWLVNVGGSVTPASQHAQPGEQPGVSGGGNQPLRPPILGQGADSGEWVINGGLVIPVYVLVLAMIGAGINTTRKVPDIQKDFDIKADCLRMLKAKKARQEDVQQAQGEVARVRTDLIETYMYFVSAPFLAIAMYYLVLMTVRTPGEPVLVVMAFATGFMSDAVVGKIIAIGEQIMKNAQAQSAAKPEAPKTPEQLAEDERERKEQEEREKAEKEKQEAAAAAAAQGSHAPTSP